MNYKVRKALDNSKKSIILVLILWVLGSIVLVSPMAVSAVDATVDRSFWFRSVYRKPIFRYTWNRR